MASLPRYYLPLLFLSFLIASSSGDPLKRFSKIELPGVVGPESIAFDCHGGGPYAGVSDGRIFKWRGSSLGWRPFAVTSPIRRGRVCDGSTDPKHEPTCGRPLGLKFDPKTCDLYVADAYFGLLAVNPQGGVAKQLAASAEGVPFRFTNALDVDPLTGLVYFTDSSITFQRRTWLMSIVHGDKTGRLLRYDPRTKKVTVLVKGLAFPNGVALSNDSSFLLLAETGTMQIHKFWLKGRRANTSEVFAQLQRFPDNIKRTDAGEFWVALNSGRGHLERLLPTVSNENSAVISWLTRDPVAVKFDAGGTVKRILDGDNGRSLESVSEVEETRGSLWIGSAVKPFVGLIRV